MADLKDAKGFRAKYINALNAAVTRNRILSSSEVLVQQTETGSFLEVLHRGRDKRFKIGFGTTKTVPSAITVGEGFLFVGGIRYTPTGKDYLLHGLGNVKTASMIMPNGKPGWTLDADTVKTAGEIEFVCARVEPAAGEPYYGIAALVDGQSLEQASGITDAKSLTTVATVGRVYKATDRAVKVVEQYLDVDIVLSGIGGGGGPNYAIGPYKIINEGSRFFEVAYFGTIGLNTEGLPVFTELLVDDGTGKKKPVEAYRVQVATHVSDHTNGVINGPL